MLLEYASSVWGFWSLSGFGKIEILKYNLKCDIVWIYIYERTKIYWLILYGKICIHLLFLKFMIDWIMYFQKTLLIKTYVGTSGGSGEKIFCRYADSTKFKLWKFSGINPPNSRFGASRRQTNHLEGWHQKICSLVPPGMFSLYSYGTILQWFV